MPEIDSAFTTEQKDQIFEALTRTAFNHLLANDGNVEGLAEALDDVDIREEFVDNALGNYCDEDLRTNINAKGYVFVHALYYRAVEAAQLRLPNFPTPPDPFSDEGLELDE